MTELTQARLKELLHYNPETGVFTRLVDTGGGRFKAGSIAGSSCGRFRKQWIDGHQYQEHRVVWLYMTGQLPAAQIDHKNLDGHDNRWSNLREATASQNGMNRRGYAKSGAKGCYFRTNPKKCGSKPWQVSIAKDGKSYHVGSFATLEEAKAARAAVTQSFHGEFARLA